MEAPRQDFRAKAAPANGTEPQHFARRIDCAPKPPLRPEPPQAPGAHGYGRAPGEGA